MLARRYDPAFVRRMERDVVEFRETVTVDNPVADVASVLHAVEGVAVVEPSISWVNRHGSGPLA